MGMVTRLRGHRGEMNSLPLSRKKKWMRKLWKAGYDPLLHWIDWCASHKEAVRLESEWTWCFHHLGAVLTNGCVYPSALVNRHPVTKRHCSVCNRSFKGKGRKKFCSKNCKERYREGKAA